MTNAPMDAQRAEFIRLTNDSWVKTRQGNAKAANSKTRASDKIVDGWVEKGSVEEFLSPLLSHPSPEVRLSAAAHLVKHGAKQPAVSVLRNLTLDPVGLVAPMAAAVLRMYEIPIEN